MTSSRTAFLIATVGGLGERVPAPGTTVGSLPAALAWWIVSALIASHQRSALAVAVAVVVVVPVAVWSASREARSRGGGDPRPVVIDEVAGQWLCLLVATAIEPVSGAGRLGVTAVAGFLLFRLFDVLKPPPVSTAERLPGGVGIVADDLVAGVLAGVVVVVLRRWLL